MGVVHELEFAPATPGGADPKLRLYVIYTSPETTRASLSVAELLAQDLDARLELLVAAVVPYPLPLSRPTTAPGFTEESLGALAGECGMQVDVKVLQCRDREETIPQWLPAESIALVGRRRHWGPGSFRKLIRSLKRKGHHVVVVDAKATMSAAAAGCRRLESR